MLIMSLIFQISWNDLKAQESFPKHQFGFSYGLLPIIGTFENDDIVDAQPFVYDKIWMGSLNLNYNYRINKLHAVGSTVSWTRNKRKPIQYDNDFYTKHSVGLINGFSLLPGVTYKHCPSQQFSMETDLNPKTLITGRLLSEKANHIVLIMVELSENFLYQRSFVQKNNISYQYIFGGGVSGAMQPFSPLVWKIGVNAFAGFEFVFLDRPISLQVDFRPGYGLLLRSAKTLEEQRHYLDLLTPGLNHNPQSCFDWAINFAIRFHK